MILHAFCTATTELRCTELWQTVDPEVKLPDSEEQYFNYMDYVNLMMPERP